MRQTEVSGKRPARARQYHLAEHSGRISSKHVCSDEREPRESKPSSRYSLFFACFREGALPELLRSTCIAISFLKVTYSV
jgi:hypothetical protein